MRALHTAAGRPASPSSGSRGRKRVVLIVQRRLPHYRVALFEALRDALARHDVQLRVAHGEPDATERSKNDSGHLPWAEHLDTRYFLGGRVCWQPYSQLLDGVDLLVVTPENKLVSNLAPQFRRRDVRFAFWGHGANLQGKDSSWRERFKRRTSVHADWWFAYTQRSARLVQALGFPGERTTVLNNATDTGELMRWREALRQPELEAQRQALGLHGAHVGVYVGSLYPVKRIGFMLDAARRIRQRVPDFEFLVVGDGPQAGELHAFCGQHPWAHALGARTGADKVAAIAQAQVMLNPGGVGLGMLDSFACGVPMITTDCGLHGPEIEYLLDGQNGLMTRDDSQEYVDAVVSCLLEPDKRQRLATACAEAAREFTLEAMVQRYVSGVLQCLDQPVQRFGRTASCAS